MACHRKMTRRFTHNLSVSYVNSFKSVDMESIEIPGSLASDPSLDDSLFLRDYLLNLLLPLIEDEGVELVIPNLIAPAKLVKEGEAPSLYDATTAAEFHAVLLDHQRNLRQHFFLTRYIRRRRHTREASYGQGWLVQRIDDIVAQTDNGAPVGVARKAKKEWACYLSYNSEQGLCPTCYNLLRLILKERGEKFTVIGNHHTVLPTPMGSKRRRGFNEYHFRTTTGTAHGSSPDLSTSEVSDRSLLIILKGRLGFMTTPVIWTSTGGIGPTGSDRSEWTFSLNFGGLAPYLSLIFSWTYYICRRCTTNNICIAVVMKKEIDPQETQNKDM